MPDTCCAVGCTNRRDQANLPFYRIPVKNEEKRQKWLVAIHREKWPERKFKQKCYSKKMMHYTVYYYRFYGSRFYKHKE